MLEFSTQFAGRVRTVDMSTFEIADSHTAPVVSVAFGSRSDVFA